MNLSAGGSGSVVFNVTYEGTRSDIGTASIIILRNGIVTTVPVAIDSSITGRYVGSFTVPSNWMEYDLVTSLFQLEYPLGTLTRTLECSKAIGVVTALPMSVEFLSDLLQADQVREGNQIVYYLKGSAQTIELHRQTQVGDPCEGNVSLIG